MRVPLSFAVVVTILAGGVLTACAPTEPRIDGISAVDFRQSQAIPDFDGSEYSQEDADEIARLADLFREHGVDPATWRGADSDCAGNRVTTATLHYAGSDVGTPLRIDSCNDTAFEQAADELFTEWREQLAG